MSAPVEPTPEMLRAGAEAMAAIKRRSGYLAPCPRDVWLAMERARTPSPTTPEDEG